MSDEVELPSKEELEILPRFSVAAYALRCAMRVQPLLVSWKKPTAEYKEAVVYLKAAYKTLGYTADSYTIRAAADAANTISDTTSNTIRATQAATADAAIVGAAAGATTRAVAANSYVTRAATGRATDAAFATALYASDAMGGADSYTIRAAARADYTRLLELKTEVTNASETGPLGDLWQGSPPDWYIKAKEEFDKTIAEWEREIAEEEGEETDSIDESHLEFYIDTGNASEEVIQEVFDAISNLSFAAGGLGFTFEKTGKAFSIVAEEVGNDF